ncbi:MAG: hypothetical protein R3B68_10300 [Phycisphaerales bacterium]
MTGRDLCAIAACASVVLGLGLPAAAQSNPNPPPRPGDWVVVTQNGAVYVAEPGGSIRSHVSGSDWRFFPPSLPTRGSGPQSGLQRFFCPPQINGDSRLVARTDETNSQSLLELDLFTGQRYEFQPATFAPGEPGLGIGRPDDGRGPTLPERGDKCCWVHAQR